MNLAESGSKAGAGIAVIIPARNAEPWIERAVASALAQPETSEVVVVDDGSTDRTAVVARDLADHNSRVIYLRPSEAPRGAGAARNLGVRACQSPILCFLDADDFLLPLAFSRAVLELTEQSVDVVLSRITILRDGTGRWEEGRNHDPAPLLTEDWLTALCRGHVGVPVCSALLRRTAFDHVGGFDETLALGQDLALWLKLACNSTAALSKGPHPVAVYLRHRKNRSEISGPEPVQAGVWACVHAWRWARSEPRAAHRARALMRGAGVRQRQLAIRAIRGDKWAGARALDNARIEPRLLTNLGFWSGSWAFSG